MKDYKFYYYDHSSAIHPGQALGFIERVQQARTLPTIY